MVPKLLGWFQADDFADDRDVLEVLEGYALAAEPVAQSLARASADTGAFGDSIDVDGTRLYADDEGALSIEFGTSDTPPHAVLRTAAETVGAKIR